jgi:nucleobase:cation symporter-1, NCS1 family
LGRVLNTAASWLNWQGYLLRTVHLGTKTGNWEFANVGVLAALAIGFLATWAFSRRAVRAQESAPAQVPAGAAARP